MNEPRDVAEFGRDLDTVRLTFDGERQVEIRVYEEAEGVLKASNEGLTLRLDQLWLLREALGRAEERLASEIVAEEKKFFEEAHEAQKVERAA